MQLVTTQSAQVLGNDDDDLAILYVGKQLLEIRPVEVRTSVTVIHIELQIGEMVVDGIYCTLHAAPSMPRLSDFSSFISKKSRLHRRWKAAQASHFDVKTHLQGDTPVPNVDCGRKQTGMTVLSYPFVHYKIIGYIELINGKRIRGFIIFTHLANEVMRFFAITSIDIKNIC